MLVGGLAVRFGEAPVAVAAWGLEGAAVVGCDGACDWGLSKESTQSANGSSSSSPSLSLSSWSLQGRPLTFWVEAHGLAAVA